MAAEDAKSDVLVGATVGARYRIISRLGVGGMGVAYRAWDEQDGIPVVVKIPKQLLFEDPTFAERFSREIRLLQGLNHQHIVPITDVGIHESLPYVVMRFLPGGSLSDRRLRDGQGTPRPNPASTLHLWLPAIASALDYVHSSGVVHRDVKPANVFFDAFWEAYLGDFGVAKILDESEAFDKEHALTATHMGVGTAEYMSPEQFTPKAMIDGRADQYALAVMAYEMLTGSRPFTGAVNHLIVEVLTHPVPAIAASRHDLPATLCAAVQKGLAKTPAERFSTCQAFAKAVLQDVPAMVDEPGVARLLCPRCANILKLSTEAAGRKGKCPRCRTAMKVAHDLGSLWLLDEARRQKGAAKAVKASEQDIETEGLNPDDQALEDFTPLSDIRMVTRPTVMHRLSEFSHRLRSGFIRLAMRALALDAFEHAAWISFAGHAALLLGIAFIPHPHVQWHSPRYIIGGWTSEEDFEEMQEDDFDADELDAAAEPSHSVVLPNAAHEVVVTEPFGATSGTVAFAKVNSTLPVARTLLSPIGALTSQQPGGYGGRTEKERKKRVASGGGSAASEAAVEAALKWINSHQLPDGGWSFDLAQCEQCKGKCSRAGEKGSDRCAATCLALLPFLARGYTHKEGPYKQQLEGGIGFLASMAVKGQGKAYDGERSKDGSMYSQGLAGITLSESYAMTQDKRLALPAQMALNFIMSAQDPVGGGWRYAPKEPGDTSVVGWQLMALKSGDLAGLNVNPLTIKKAVDFLNGVQDDDGSCYGYTGPGDGVATSAVGLLCRMNLGWKKDHPALQRGVARLARLGPSKDLYYNYYATQIMHHMEGDVWQAWNATMRDGLVKAQAKQGHEAGSWCDGYDEGYGPPYGGRLYCTSMATLILEVYYRHLPLYGTPASDQFKE